MPSNSFNLAVTCSQYTMRNYDSTFGALLIGCMVSIYLFGINTSQTWIYLRSYPNDRWQMKAFIVILWLLEFVHTILAGWTVYGSLITKFCANNFAQLHFDLILTISNFLSVSIATLVQLFFAYRSHKISNFVIIPFIATALSLLRLLCYTGATIHHLLHGTQAKSWLWSLFSFGILSITSDLLVAGGLSYSLWKRRMLWKAHSDHPSWWPRIIDQLIIISLQADAFICIVSTVTLILYNVSSNFLWMAVSLVACRLFSISCLASIFSARNLSQQIGGDMLSLAVIPVSATMPPCDSAFGPGHMLEMVSRRLSTSQSLPSDSTMNGLPP